MPGLVVGPRDRQASIRRIRKDRYPNGDVMCTYRDPVTGDRFTSHEDLGETWFDNRATPPPQPTPDSQVVFSTPSGPQLLDFLRPSEPQQQQQPAGGDEDSPIFRVPPYVEPSWLQAKHKRSTAEEERKSYGMLTIPKLQMDPIDTQIQDAVEAIGKLSPSVTKIHGCFGRIVYRFQRLKVPEADGATNKMKKQKKKKWDDSSASSSSSSSSSSESEADSLADQSDDDDLPSDAS